MSAHGAGAISLLLAIANNRDVQNQVIYQIIAVGSGGSTKSKDPDMDSIELLKNLSLALQKDHPIDAKQNFASGAVYLAQMMAHDVLKTEHPLEGIASREFNRVRRPFMLDSLYGAGPDIEPHLYAELDQDALDNNEVQFDTPRTVFRDSKMIRTTHGNAADLPRKRGINEDGKESYVGCPGVFGAGEPIVADRRNDSHTIIAQLVGVWMRLHNYIFERKSEALISQHLARLKREDMKHQMVEYRFRATQQAMRWIWHSVIEHDVLPVLFLNHAELLKQYEERFACEHTQPPKLDPPSGATTALRSLHSLVRQTYNLISEEQKALLSQANKNVQRKAHALREIIEVGFPQDLKWAGQVFPKHNDNWAITWSEFFDYEGRSKASNRTSYRVHYVQQLVVDALQENQELMFLDFIRSSMSESKITPEHEQYRLLKKLQSDVALRNNVLKHITDPHLKSEFASAHLPTTVLILSEAELRGNGLCLGQIGTELLAPWLLEHLAAAKSTIEIDFSSSSLPRTMTEIFELLEPLAVAEGGSKHEERKTT